MTYHQAYYLKNRDKKLAYQKEWAAANKDKVKQYTQDWRSNNKELANARTETYRKANLDKHRNKEARRRAAKLNATPKWLNPSQLQDIEQYYIDAAYVQQLMQTPMEVDHIVPLQGRNVSGLHVPWNLQILTESENCSKGNR